VNQTHEVRYSTEKFGVSADELRKAVQEGGPVVDKVQQRLRGKGTQ